MKKTLGLEERVIGDLRRQHVHRSARRQKHVMSSPALASGNISLAFHRGLAQGRNEAHKESYRALKRKHPKAAVWFYDELGLKDHKIRK